MFKKSLSTSENRFFSTFEKDFLHKYPDFFDFFLCLDDIKAILKLLFKKQSMFHDFDELDISMKDKVQFLFENLPDKNALLLFNQELVKDILPNFDKSWFKCYFE